MTVQSPPIYAPLPGRDRYVIVVGVLIVVVIVLAAFLGLALSSNGFSSFRSFGTPRINPPSTASLSPPPSNTPGPNDPLWTLLWNSCGGYPYSCSMNSTGWREGGIPDTFDYSVTFTSNVPVTVYFLTLPQYMQYAYCNGRISCVSGAYNMTSPSMSIQNLVFKLAEGCADYVAIYQSTGSGSMSPTIKIARNSYPAPTGVCQTSV